MVYMMKEEQDIICPPEPYNKESCFEFLPEQLATYYANHSELLFRKLQDHGDALNALLTSKTARFAASNMQVLIMMRVAAVRDSVCQ